MNKVFLFLFLISAYSHAQVVVGGSGGHPGPTHPESDVPLLNGFEEIFEFDKSVELLRTSLILSWNECGKGQFKAKDLIEIYHVLVLEAGQLIYTPENRLGCPSECILSANVRNAMKEIVENKNAVSLIKIRYRISDNEAENIVKTFIQYE